MKRASIAAVAALMGLATVATAQTVPAAPATNTTEPQHTPDVAAANADAQEQAAARSGSVATDNATAQAQYDQDMAAYRASLRANHRAAARDARRHDRQQRAYADAMAAWRQQVDACHHGNTAACKAPTPDPASFW